MKVKAIHSTRCWIDNTFQQATVHFDAGKITFIEKGFTPRREGILDVGDAVLMPGVIDAHVHVNEPGRTDWEGFDTATMAAAAGGTTTIIDMPLNASPVTTSADALQLKLASTEGKLHVNCGFYGGLVPGNITEVEGLIEAGIIGMKAFLTHSGIDEFPNVTEADLDAAMPLLAKHGVPLLVHCELDDDDHSAHLKQYPTSYQAYLSSRPKLWENRAIEMMIGLCRKHRCRTHIVHVSSAEALAMISEAKAEGLPITAETCPQYLLFDAAGIPDGATMYKCAPPIRVKENNDQLKQALASGILDFLATDHSPAPPAIKELVSGNFLKAWGGIAGLQFLLSSSWTALRDTLTLPEFIPLLTEQPARFLGLDQRKGKLQVGFDADLVVWSPEDSSVVDSSSVLHKHKVSPYVGQQLYGLIKHTIVNGEVVFSNNTIQTKNTGTWLLKK